MTAAKDKTDTNQDQSSPDFFALSQALMQACIKIQPLMIEAMGNLDFEKIKDTPLPLNSIQEAYDNYIQAFMDDPQKFAQMQMDLTQKWMDLWQKTFTQFINGEAAPKQDIPTPKDRRFSSKLWNDSPFFSFIKQYYMMVADTLLSTVNEAEHIDDDTKTRVQFYLKQYIDAIAPTNFLFTNPDVIQQTIDSDGENLVRGFENFVKDLNRGKGLLKISTTDYEAFEVGKNLAVTKGKVVFQNHLMELIQYAPTTKDVYKTPILITAPWINKFYILDLREKNSFVKWLVDQGFTVFIISWKNPDKTFAEYGFETYMQDGVLCALDAIEDICGVKETHAIGYCIGGTLLTITLAYLHENDQASRVKSATFFTTLVDFSHAGDLKLFMDNKHLDMIESEMQTKGYLPAETFRNTFSMIRANDMIWSFVVNNYLLGQTPFPFDILFWNDDTTNMPAGVHRMYLRDFYLENKLTKPNAVKVLDTPIDVTKIKTPSYCLATIDDHIVPWISAYKTTQLLSGNTKFVLSASGHVAGVVNHPDRNKYCYWSNSKTPKSADDWYGNAKMTEGSWWPDMVKWLVKQSDAKVPARTVGSAKHKPLSDAPGTYVKIMS